MKEIDYTKTKNNTIKVDGGDIEFFIDDEAQKLYLAICNYNSITGLDKSQAKELGSRLLAWSEEPIKTRVVNLQLKDVHTEHCCLKHGCQYGNDETCSVTQRLGPQNSSCEICNPLR